MFRVLKELADELAPTRSAPVPSAQMIFDIKSACGIFLKDKHQTMLTKLQPEVLRIVWENRDKVRNVVFYNEAIFFDLMKLNQENMKIFFTEIAACPFFDVPQKLALLIQIQSEQASRYPLGGPLFSISPPYMPAVTAYPQQPGYMPQQPGYMPQRPAYMPQQPGYMPQQTGGYSSAPSYQPGYPSQVSGYLPTEQPPGYYASGGPQQSPQMPPYQPAEQHSTSQHYQPTF